VDPLPTHPDDLVQRKPRSDRAGFLYRLSIYCIGIAIGFMILGMFRAKSAVEARRRQAEQAALEAQYPQDPAPAPTPAVTQPPNVSPAASPTEQPAPR